MEKELLLMGAFDRYNYGDLLFPIIMKKYIDKYRPEVNEYYSKIIPVALENKNLDYIGGLPTTAWKDLNPNIPKDIIVVGGDVLGATNSGLYMDSLNSFSEQLVVKVIQKFISFNYVEKRAEKKFQTNNILPYVPKRESNIEKVVYNSVSGSGLIANAMKKDKKDIIIDRLKKSNYVSVRDLKTHESLLDSGVEVKLAPDSAAIMEEFYPIDQLLEKVSDERIINLENKKYIVIQCGYWKSKNNIEEIVEQLQTIASKTDVEIVLLPVGFATNHDDVIVLKKISKKLKFQHHFFDKLSIWDIMFIIGASEFFFGTSLHGNITAMAYGVPHVGLNKNIGKVDKYLATWGTAPFNQNIEFGQISSFYLKNRNFDCDLLRKNSDKVKTLVYENNNALLDKLLLK